MIAAFRASTPEARKHDAPGDHDICCVVRKRPINPRELKLKDWDSVTCFNPRVVVHAPKLKVDGITKFLVSMGFPGNAWCLTCGTSPSHRRRTI